ncbi:MAG: cytochrome c-type biogenesis protein CcmH [Hyphomicrobium sp.]
MRRLLAAFAILWLALSPALAVQPDEILADAAQETRARALSAHLRCLVCQNQSIDDSNAPLARDLRLLVRERIVAGDDDGAVMDYITERYGDFVLLKPPFKPETLILWLTPVLLLLAGVWLARNASRSSRDGAVESALNEDEKAKLDSLLRKDA